METLLHLLVSLEWVIDLLSLSVASPVVLPYRIDLPWWPHFLFLHQDFRMFYLLSWWLFSDLLDILVCLRAWPVSLLCVVTVFPVAFASTCGIVLGVGAPVRVFQCRTLLSPRLQVSFLSLEEGHLYLSALKGHRFVFPSVFTYKLPELRVAFVRWDLIHPF